MTETKTTKKKVIFDLLSIFLSNHSRSWRAISFTECPIEKLRDYKGTVQQVLSFYWPIILFLNTNSIIGYVKFIKISKLTSVLFKNITNP